MSKSHQSNYDKYGYTKTKIESNGKSIGAAECWVCKIPLHNTGITSLKRHRNKCKLEEGKMTTSKWGTETEKCFICNETSNHCIPITTESKHTATRFSVFVRQFLSDNKSEPNVHDDLDGQMMCDKCIDKINEYDLACLTAERVAKEMCEILRKNENVWWKERDDDNHSENVSTFDMKPEIEKIEVDCSFDDESFDGNDFIDFDHASTDKNDTEDESPSRRLNETNIHANGTPTIPKAVKIRDSSVDGKLPEGNFINVSRSSAARANKMEKRSYECFICSAKYTNFNDLEKHCATHTSEVPNRHRCKICNFIAENQTELDKHIGMHDGLSPLQCVICLKRLRYKRNITQHMQHHTVNVAEYQCNKCGEKFAQRTALTDHVNTHSGNTKLMCDYCQSSFTKKWNLKMHMAVHRRNGFRKYSKKPHTDSSETANKHSYQCAECPAIFTTQKDIKKHCALHKRDENPFKCGICNWNANDGAILAKHVEQHQGLAALQCVICHKMFIHKRNITRHMRLHTGEKLYQCERCGKDFFHLSSFTVHMKYHDGVRSEKCPMCPRLFLGKFDLKKHLAVHSTEKSYKCDICQKAFTHHRNMTEHRKIHYRDPTDRAHKCSFCEALFSRKSNLTKHLEKHGAIVPHTEIQNKLTFV